jgi:hypothetical protein
MRHYLKKYMTFLPVNDNSVLGLSLKTKKYGKL